MKKLLTLFIIAIISFIFSLNYTNANDYINEIDDLKDKIEIEKNYLKNFDKNNFLRNYSSWKNEILEEYWEALNNFVDLEYKLAELEWNVYDYNSNNINTDDVDNYTTFSRYTNNNFFDKLEVWDIISLSTKYESAEDKFWQHFITIVKTWTHSVIYIWNWKIISADWPKSLSRVYDVKEYFKNKHKDLHRIVITRVKLTDKEKENLRLYSRRLINRPYPSVLWINLIKYSTIEFYCSSLAWRAHYSSWKKIDLDPNSWGSIDIIFPQEFMLTAEEKFFIKF